MAEPSWGVGGTGDGVDADADGVGLEGSEFGSAIGKVSESLLGIRAAESEEHEWRANEDDGVVMCSAGSGGGGMVLVSLPESRFSFCRLRVVTSWL